MKRLKVHQLLPRIAALLVAAILLLLVAHSALACPTCKDGVAANDPQHAGMVKGYFYSILFMMSMPFLLLGSFSLYMYREVCKARARDAAKAPLEPPSLSSSLPPHAAPSPERELIEV